MKIIINDFEIDFFEVDKVHEFDLSTKEYTLHLEGLEATTNENENDKED